MQVLFTTFLKYKWMSQEYTLGKSNNLVTPWTNLKIKKTAFDSPWKIYCWFPLGLGLSLVSWENFHSPAAQALVSVKKIIPYT